MAVTQEQIDTAISTAIERGGVVTAQIADQLTTFESWDQFEQRIRWMRQQVSGAVRTRYIATDKDV